MIVGFRFFTYLSCLYIHTHVFYFILLLISVKSLILAPSYVPLLVQNHVFHPNGLPFMMTS